MFDVNNLKITPEILSFVATAETTEPTKLTFAIPGSVSFIDPDFSTIKKATIRVPNTSGSVFMNLIFENITGDVKKYTCSAAIRTNTFSEPFYDMLKEVIGILIKKNNGDFLLGLTYFMNFVKASIRTLDFTSFGVPNLSPEQITVFQDQMTYYYALVSGQRSVDAFINKVYSWFKYLNVDNINPALPLITPEQKAIILQVLDTTINSVIWGDLSDAVERLNRKNLITADSPLRGVYSSINNGTILSDPIAINYLNLCQSGIGDIVIAS
jgi:hypothetical protein